MRDQKKFLKHAYLFNFPKRNMNEKERWQVEHENLKDREVVIVVHAKLTILHKHIDTTHRHVANSSKYTRHMSGKCLTRHGSMVGVSILHWLSI